MKGNTHLHQKDVAPVNPLAMYASPGNRSVAGSKGKLKRVPVHRDAATSGTKGGDVDSTPVVQRAQFQPARASHRDTVPTSSDSAALPGAILTLVQKKASVEC